MRKIKLENGKEVTISEESYNELSKSLTQDKKYELLTDRPILYRRRTLYQIKALRDFNDVKKGDLGGFIEKEENLSHTGNCWVSNLSKVYDDAMVYGNAWVTDDARVFGDARIYDDARVSGDARVFDAARVYGDAKVYGTAEISFNAKVYGDAKVYGTAVISFNAKVYGNSDIF